MGYIRDHAIVVVNQYGDWVDKAHQEAVKIFGDKRVSPVLGPFTNGSMSFFVAPDGSKEGWSESDENDGKRDAFVAWLNAQRYVDGSSPLQWVEVRVSDDEHELAVERSYVDARTPEAPRV